ncbi:MAG: S-adenosylmethionine:tRNA ribosyltransferase-isomerase [Parcubacteria group bacterium Athens1014_26]|nr:MAG: S-adenosylmethionine:tRNA ribosyltransferase-isomerase [Parcubacteria group bacterium Athens1014_26]
MSVQFEKILKQYDYFLPKELIAQKPESLRDNARLLIYKRTSDKIFYDKFANIIKYLPKNAVLVFNETKVLPARLTVYKQTGGKVRILYIGNYKDNIKVLSDRALKIGSRINLNLKIFFIVEGRRGKYFFLKPSFPVSKIYKILIRYGFAPIPPYIKKNINPFSPKILVP